MAGATGSPAGTEARIVAGIDRWRGGWIIALGGADDLQLLAADDADDAVDLTASAVVVAIDMPMALPVRGQRAAEAELRAGLGAAGRSVFTSPTRHAIDADDQAEATRRNRANDGPGISAQAWGLAGSIRELRETLPRRGCQARWFETHPESAFARMNGGPALASKRSGRGVGERLGLLRQWCAIDELLVAAPMKVPVDDALDAVAAWWSAHRIANDEAEVLGETGPDDEGFERSIRI